MNCVIDKILHKGESVQDKEGEAREKTNDYEIAVENVDVDIEWGEAKFSWLQ